MLINFALLALLVFLGWQLRLKMLQAKQREAAILEMRVPPADVPKPAGLAKVPALDANAYQDAVAKNLFSKDRNPIPIPDPPAAPPPPPPVPPFPVARGVMIWDGVPPTVVLSASKGSNEQRGYHPGDRIGEWRIDSVDNQFIVLEWNGKTFKKRLDELMERTPVQAENTQQVAQAAAPAPAAKSLGESKSGFGPDMGAGLKACVAGDTTPAGTVKDGLKKVVTQTPFSPNGACRWEPVQ